ncbi:hypothetical protein N7462_005864 [Penicillium macrosclerotiorum]|uniref:uncharacterized protein n=1 Tax=Penicillium macrosclerotiorum TaxID=303699 RepID=UPI0025465ECE|nr:uncharacterized protein N7462_005864 [Penicillium macrosclerotiorum]KAJ5682699.1 hypothetical protein N7462_005864 [Penicillium macrosclerotiorum]
MAVESRANRRIGASKSRNGCKTCNTGRKCEYEGPSSPLAPSTPSSLSPAQALPLSPNSGWRERRAFEYYFQHAAKCLAGGMAIDFWTSVVPQICRTEPSVWDAVIAISSLFEHPDQCMDFTLLRSRGGNSQYLNKSQQEALVWYSRSISSVHSQIKRRGADPYIALISCVMFICIETIQGRMEEALQLYRQGTSLIMDLRAQVRLGIVCASKTMLLERMIIPLFLRLGTVSLTISGTQPSELFTATETRLNVPFESIAAARSAIAALGKEIILFDREARCHLRAVGGESFVAPEMLEKKNILKSHLDDWYQAYSDLCNPSQDASLSQMSTEPVLLTHHAAAKVHLAGCLTVKETVYDAHLADFAIIVEQANLVLGISAGPDGSQPPFTFEMGVGIPLFKTAMVCRDQNLRHRALELLRQAPPMQGFFKCTPVAMLAESIMKIEESNAQQLLGLYGNDCSSTNTPSSKDPQNTESHSTLIPEEARISFCGVFRPADGLPPNVSEENVSQWGLGPDQLFLEFSRNYFDTPSNSWQQVRNIVPLNS